MIVLKAILIAPGKWLKLLHLLCSLLVWENLEELRPARLALARGASVLAIDQNENLGPLEVNPCVLLKYVLYYDCLEFIHKLKSCVCVSSYIYRRKHTHTHTHTHIYSSARKLWSFVLTEIISNIIFKISIEK
jgi:hypothetical protein